MSRKSRQRAKPELAPDEPSSEPVGDGRANVHRLTGNLNDMLEAIVSGCAIIEQSSEFTSVVDAADEALQGIDATTFDDLLRGAVTDARPDVVDRDLGDSDHGDGELLDEELDDTEDELTDEEIDDEIGELGDAFGGLTLTTRILARGLLSRALNRPPVQAAPWLTPSSASAAEGDAQTALLDELARTLLPANLPKALQPSRADRREAFEDAAFLIREVALEEFDMSCDLIPTRGGTAELFAYPVSPEGAHVALLEFLLNRAENVAEQLDPLLAVERDASFWEFSCWSVSPPPGRGTTEVNEFSRAVREQEYALVERTTVTLGRRVIAEITQDEGFADLVPRQHRMATALAESWVDVFECAALQGTQVTLRSVRDGRTFQVHEHMDPIAYAPGWIAAGRLLPFDDDVFLRSPGMMFFRPNHPAEMNSGARAFEGARAALSPALAVEAFISSAMFGVAVPRVMKPARSKSDARALLSMIDDIIADAELERASVPTEVYYVPGLPRDGRPADTRGIRLDATLEAYMAALKEQASGGDQERRQRARTTKRKGNRRR